MNRAELGRALDAILAELAVDPVAVMMAAGVKGRPGTYCSCPVAVFIRMRLRATIGRDLRVWVTPSTVRVRLVSRKMPERLRETVTEVDEGDRLELCHG